VSNTNVFTFVDTLSRELGAEAPRVFSIEVWISCEQLSISLANCR
jgi:hypothetical protein